MIALSNCERLSLQHDGSPQHQAFEHLRRSQCLKKSGTMDELALVNRGAPRTGSCSRTQSQHIPTTSSSRVSLATSACSCACGLRSLNVKAGQVGVSASAQVNFAQSAMPVCVPSCLCVAGTRGYAARQSATTMVKPQLSHDVTALPSRRSSSCENAAFDVRQHGSEAGPFPDDPAVASEPRQCHVYLPRQLIGPATPSLDGCECVKQRP